MNLFSGKMIGVLLVLALVAVGVMYALEDDLSSSMIETVEARASRVLGTRVDVSDARVDWDAGTVSLSGLVVANPGGFSNQDMISVDEIDARLEPGARVVKEVALHGVRAVVEFRGSRSNFEAIDARIADSAETATATAKDDAGEAAAADAGKADVESAAESRAGWRVERIAVDGVQVSVQADWTSKVFEMKTAGLVMESLDAGTDDLVRAVATRFLYQVLATAARDVDDHRLREILQRKAAQLSGGGRDRS